MIFSCCICLLIHCLLLICPTNKRCLTVIGSPTLPLRIAPHCESEKRAKFFNQFNFISAKDCSNHKNICLGLNCDHIYNHSKDYLEVGGARTLVNHHFCITNPKLVYISIIIKLVFQKVIN